MNNCPSVMIIHIFQIVSRNLRTASQYYFTPHTMVLDDPTLGGATARPIRLVENPSYCERQSRQQQQEGQEARGGAQGPPAGVHASARPHTSQQKRQGVKRDPPSSPVLPSCSEEDASAGKRVPNPSGGRFQEESSAATGRSSPTRNATSPTSIATNNTTSGPGAPPGPSSSSSAPTRIGALAAGSKGGMKMKKAKLEPPLLPPPPYTVRQSPPQTRIRLFYNPDSDDPLNDAFDQQDDSDISESPDLAEGDGRNPVPSDLGVAANSGDAAGQNQNLIDLTRSNSSDSDEDDIQVLRVPPGSALANSVEVDLLDEQEVAVDDDDEHLVDDSEDGNGEEDEDDEDELIDPITPVLHNPGEIGQAEIRVVQSQSQPSATGNNPQSRPASFDFDTTQQLHREPIASPRLDGTPETAGHPPPVHHHCCPPPPTPNCPHSTCTCHHRPTPPHAPCGACYAAAAGCPAHHYHLFHHHHHHHHGSQGSTQGPACQLHSPCPTHCPYGTSHPTVTPAPVISSMAFGLRQEQPQATSSQGAVSPVVVSGHQEEGVAPRVPRRRLGAVGDGRPQRNQGQNGSGMVTRPSGNWSLQGVVRPPQGISVSVAAAPMGAPIPAHQRQRESLLDHQNQMAERRRQAMNPWFDRQRSRHAAGNFHYGRNTSYFNPYDWTASPAHTVSAQPQLPAPFQAPQQSLFSANFSASTPQPHVAYAQQQHRADSPALQSFRVPVGAPRQARRQNASGSATGYFLVSPTGPAVPAPTQVIQAAAAASAAAVAQATQQMYHPLVQPSAAAMAPGALGVPAELGTFAVGPFYFGTGEIIGTQTFTVAGPAEPQPVGANQQTIEQYTETRRYRRPSTDVPEGEEERCTVCLSEFETEENVRELRCAHIFHVECIDRWLILNKKCPICRVEVDRGPGACGAAASASEPGASGTDAAAARNMVTSPEVLFIGPTGTGRSRPFHSRAATVQGLRRLVSQHGAAVTPHHPQIAPGVAARPQLGVQQQINPYELGYASEWSPEQ